MAKEYLFKVTIEGFDGRRLWRKIAMRSNATLYGFAGAILDAFGFDFDHCFGFYSNTKRNMYDSERVYEYFVDLKEEDEGLEVTPDAKPTKKTRLDKVWKKAGDTMLFLFDYGDEWRFPVRLEQVGAVRKGAKYPHVIDSKGEAPEQYPDEEDSEGFMALEDGEGGDLFDGETFVATALGGDGKRMRCYFAIHTTDGGSFSKKAQVAVAGASSKADERCDAVTEDIEYGEGYALIRVLVPLTIAPAEYIETVIDACSRGANLAHDYLANNVFKPDPEDIALWLRGETPPGFWDSERRPE
jgi:hypothetical protein